MPATRTPAAAKKTTPAAKAAQISRVCAAAVAASQTAGPTVQVVAAALSVFLQAVGAASSSSAKMALKPANRIRLKLDTLKAKVR